MEEKLVQNSRHQDILQLLEAETTLSIKELASLLGVSLVTVRRDLDILQKYNKVKKFHGSVSLNRSDSPQTLFNLSLENNAAEKKAIAKVASTLIQHDSVISIDASSSAYYIADYISQLTSLKVIVYSLLSALKFSSIPKASVFQLGGTIDPHSATTCDFFTIESIKNFNSDIAFFSNHTIDSINGGFDSVYSIEVKNALIDITKRSVLLADSSKFEKTAMCLSVPMSKIDTIVTDENVPEESVKNIVNAGVELYIAKIEDGSILKHYESQKK